MRQAEQQLLGELARLQQRGAAPQLSPALDSSLLARVAPLSPQQAQHWEQVLGRIAAVNAADARWRGGSGGSRSSAAAGGKRVAGKEVAAKPAAIARDEHASGTVPAQAPNGSKAQGGPHIRDAGRAPAGEARASTGGLAGTVPRRTARALKTRRDCLHFDELEGIAAAGGTPPSRRASALA